LNRSNPEGVEISMHTTILETIEASLEAQLAAVRSLREKRSPAAKPKPGRKKSNPAVVEEVLARAEGPLHITEIMRRAELLFGRELERDSVVSAISKLILHHERFVRIAPNTFALRPDATGEGQHHAAG
jgi:hypothetical protein